MSSKINKIKGLIVKYYMILLLNMFILNSFVTTKYICLFEKENNIDF